MSMNLCNIAVLNIKGSDYLCIINFISKNEELNAKILIWSKKAERYKNIKKLLSHIKMGKNVLTFAILKLKKTIQFLKDVDIEKVLVSKKIFLVKKIISTLFITCIMIIKLTNYFWCFLKQALM